MNPQGDAKQGRRQLSSIMAEVAAGRSGWLQSMRQWNYDIREGTLAVGSPNRLLILGQAPARGQDEAPPFDGRSGALLARLMVCESAKQLRERCDVMNVWPWYEGKTVSGDYFDRRAARDLMACVRIHARQIVLLGEATLAFGVRVKQPWFDPFRMAERPEPIWYRAPHPSGRCRWWVVPNNVKRAETFYERLRKSA